MLDPREVLDRLEGQKPEVDPEQAAAAMELAVEMAALKERIRKGEELLKELKARHDAIRKEELPDTMFAAGLVAQTGKGSFTMADGQKVYLTTDMFVHIASGQRDAFYAWLRNEGHGDLVVDYVHPSTLKAFVKEQMAQGVELPEELIAAHPFLKAALRKA